MLVVQSNVANTYERLGRFEESNRMQRDVYLGRLRLNGGEHGETLRSAYNYAHSLGQVQRFEEAKTLLRKTTPVARRTLGEGHEITLKMREIYAALLYEDSAATLDDLREAVTTLEEIERTARRVFGSGHPTVDTFVESLGYARAALAARETPSRSA